MSGVLPIDVWPDVLRRVPDERKGEAYIVLSTLRGRRFETEPHAANAGYSVVRRRLAVDPDQPGYTSRHMASKGVVGQPGGEGAVAPAPPESTFDVEYPAEMHPLVRMLARGMTQKQIGAALGKSPAGGRLMVERLRIYTRKAIA